MNGLKQHFSLLGWCRHIRADTGGVGVIATDACSGRSLTSSRRTRFSSAYVAFNRLLVTDFGAGRIEPGRFAGLTLVEQVPTLVQCYLDLTKLFPIRVGCFTQGLLPPDLVLLVGQFVNVLKHSLVLHNLPSSSEAF